MTPRESYILELKGERERKEERGLGSGWEILQSALGLKFDFVPSCCVILGTDTPSLKFGTSLCEMG